jgi:hypothetical protein
LRLPAAAAEKTHAKDSRAKGEKEEIHLLKAGSTAMPLKLKEGEVVFSASLVPDTVAAAKVAIARCIMYSKTKLPETLTECPFEREKLRLVFKAGHEAALNGKSADEYPFLHAKNVSEYIDAEVNIMYAYGKHWANKLEEATKGNPHAQVQSDIVTLADRMPRQSIGHYSVCPVTNKEMVVASAFRQVLDKSNKVCAKDMEEQCWKFFGRKQLHFAHSIVTDVGAFGLGAALEVPYDGQYTLVKDKCMMHQTGKFCAFGMGTYGYKDGSGNDAFPCQQLPCFLTIG